MKRTVRYVFFFSVVLLLYGLVNFYIIHNGIFLFLGNHTAKRVWTVSIIFLAAAFPAGRWLEKASPGKFSTVLIWIGAFWLGIMVYLFLQLLVIDLIRVLDKGFRFLPSWFNSHPAKVRSDLALVVASVSFIFVAGGFINTWFPKIKTLKLTINKKAGKLTTLHIVAFSDMHLGTLIGKNRLSRLVSKVNALDPDIILIPGDIIDEDVGTVVRGGAGLMLQQLKARYGTYAVTGNHEYIGGVDRARTFLTQNGVKLLSDTTLLIDNSFYLAGREDLSMNWFGKKGRKPLDIIVEGVQKELPLILLDHQPFHLKQARQSGVDLQLSGHTHHGQLWPFNGITNLIYERSRGYLRKGNTHYYVSCGVGGWGPPIRTVSRPEILDIYLYFNHP